MEVPGIPPSVPFRQVQDMIRSLGIDPDHVRSLILDKDGFRVEVFALDEHGRRYASPGGDTVAMHTIQIKLEA